jgi:hypothetical protein
MSLFTLRHSALCVWVLVRPLIAGKGAVKAGIDVASSVIVKAIKAYTTGEP